MLIYINKYISTSSTTPTRAGAQGFGDVEECRNHATPEELHMFLKLPVIDETTKAVKSTIINMDKVIQISSQRPESCWVRIDPNAIGSYHVALTLEEVEAMLAGK